MTTQQFLMPRIIAVPAPAGAVRAKWPRSFVTFLLAAVMAACRHDSPPAVGANTPPSANAGPDQAVQLGSTVTLNGSASSDVDGDSLSFAWTMTARPTGSTAALSIATGVT